MAIQLGYTKDHEWIRIEEDVAVVGISDYAADQLGDVVYVDLPSVGDTVTVGQIVAEAESTKSVGEIFAPVAGEIIEINETVADNPELVNQDPFGAAWLFKIRFAELPEFLSEAEYLELTGE